MLKQGLRSNALIGKLIKISVITKKMLEVWVVFLRLPVYISIIFGNTVIYHGSTSQKKSLSFVVCS